MTRPVYSLDEIRVLRRAVELVSRAADRNELSTPEFRINIAEAAITFVRRSRWRRARRVGGPRMG